MWAYLKIKWQFYGTSWKLERRLKVKVLYHMIKCWTDVMRKDIFALFWNGIMLFSLRHWYLLFYLKFLKFKLKNLSLTCRNTVALYILIQGHRFCQFHLLILEFTKTYKINRILFFMFLHVQSGQCKEDRMIAWIVTSISPLYWYFQYNSEQKWKKWQFLPCVMTLE